MSARAVLWGVMQAQTNKAIARELGITVQTVKNHLHRWSIRSHCHDRTRLCLWAWREAVR